MHTNAVAADDCEVGATGRKACKDCTCGRAEAEAAGVKVQLTDDMIQNPGVGSSCGNVSARFEYTHCVSITGGGALQVCRLHVAEAPRWLLSATDAALPLSPLCRSPSVPAGRRLPLRRLPLPRPPRF